MKDVRSIAEDMDQELRFQDKPLQDIKENMNLGQQNVQQATDQLQMTLDRRAAQNKKMGSICLLLFLIVCMMFYMLIGNPFSGLEVPAELMPMKSYKVPSNKTEESPEAKTESQPETQPETQPEPQPE